MCPTAATLSCRSDASASTELPAPAWPSLAERAGLEPSACMLALVMLALPITAVVYGLLFMLIL